jgi:hypothetical protein
MSKAKDISEIISDANLGGTLDVVGVLTGTSLDISGDVDVDGTLEADAITLNGTAIGSIYSPIAGGTGILTTGALNAGSITSGFGTIDNGASAITSTGVGSFGSLDISGDIDVDGTTNLDVVDIDGAVDMASTVLVTGVLTTTAATVFNGGFASNAASTLTVTEGNHVNGLKLINSQPGGYGSALTFQSERSDNNAIVSAAQIRTQGQDSWNSEASADSNLFFATSLNGSLTDKMVIKDDGNVGIGTSSPDYLVEVEKANGDHTGTAIAITNSQNGGYGSVLNFVSKRDDAGNVIASQIGTQGDSSWNSDASTSSNLLFSTVNANTLAERMRITSAGNVGIGTSSPTGKLDIVGGTTYQPHLRITNNAGGGRIYGINVGVAALSNGYFSIKDETADAYRMVITDSGNVGIGTTSPGELLSLYKASGDPALRIQSSAGNCYVVNRAGTSGMDLLNAMNGPMTFGTNNAERMRIDSSGKVYIGTTTNVNAGAMIVQQAGNGTGITVNGVNNTSGAVFMYFTEAGANCGYIQRVGTTSAVTYATSSDYRLKENVTPMTGALAKVSLLKPVTFDWKAGGSSQGFIAHELQEVIPDAVTGVKDQVNENGSINSQGVDTSYVVATLTSAIQEQQALIEALTARITALEGA